MRFVGDHDDVVSVRQHRHLGTLLLRKELVDQCEDVAVVLAK